MHGRALGDRLCIVRELSVIPLHRIQFTWGVGRQIEIEWARGRGVEMPVAANHPSASIWEQEAELDEFGRRGIPAMCWRDDVAPLFEPFQLRENSEYFIDVTLPVSKEEAVALAAQSRAWPFADRLAAIFLPDPPRRWRQTGARHMTISGHLRLKSHAGILDLRTDFDMPLVAEGRPVVKSIIWMSFRRC